MKFSIVMFIFSNAVISAPPTTNNANPVPSNETSISNSKNIIATTGGTSKIMHPSEDLSLEELRARFPKYQKMIEAAHAAKEKASPALLPPQSEVPKYGRTWNC